MAMSFGAARIHCLGLWPLYLAHNKLPLNHLRGENCFFMLKLLVPNVGTQGGCTFSLEETR